LSTVWHLYLLECEDGFLYTGITTDVERRFQDHLAGKGARYTRSHKPSRLLASRPVGTQSEALRAELAIKRLPRDKKLSALLLRPAFPIDERHHTMNKSELIDSIAKEADITKAAAGKVVEAATEAIMMAVANGDSVALSGFGTFKSSERAARTGRNPQTGKELEIAATTVPRFTAGAAFKAAVKE